MTEITSKQGKDTPLYRGLRYTRACVGMLLLMLVAPLFGYSQTDEVYLCLENFDPANHDGMVPTRYTESRVDAQDTVWIKYVPVGQPIELKLKAVRKNGSPATITLFQFKRGPDYYTAQWVPVGNPINGESEHTFTVSEPGGYKVLFVDGATTLESTTWVFVDDVEFQRTFSRSNCEQVDLGVAFSIPVSQIQNEKFTYYDLGLPKIQPIAIIGRDYFTELSPTKTNPYNRVSTIFWRDIQGTLTEMRGPVVVVQDPPPYTDWEYKVEVQNMFGRTLIAFTDPKASTGVQPAKAVKAKLQVDIDESRIAGVPSWKSAGDQPEGDSPFRIRLGNMSQNTTVAWWTIRNDPRAVRQGHPDTLLMEKVEKGTDPWVYPNYEIFTAGFYTAKLRVENTLSQCKDSVTIPLHVDSSLISPDAIPNVFTPNGDGLNDVFAISNPTQNARGIKSFRVVIMNRNGASVYQYKGDPVTWEGWNGRRNNKGAMMPEGVYFFVLHGEGYDGKEFDGGPYKGFVYLFLDPRRQ